MSREVQIINPVEKFKEPEWKNVFALDEKALGELRERVDRNKGVVRLAVHPLFDVHTIKNRPGERLPYWYDSEKSNRIRLGFKNTLQKQGLGTPPVLIMEEDASLQRTKECINSWNLALTSPLYYVPTHLQTSEPKPKINSKQYDNENWSDFIRTLNKIDARKIILSGMMFKILQGFKPDNEMADFMTQRVSKGAKYLNYDVQNCVRSVLENLSSKFDIEISGMTFPYSRTDLHKIEKHKNKY